ncbi:MAG: hypothetical protein ACTSQD_04140 [Promethearchaeota archaeon]|jgi:hypothetical protein
MSSHTRKEDLLKSIKNGSRFEKVKSFNMDYAKKRKSNFISELNAFLYIHADTNEKYKTISDFIEICETTNEELYLLKVFSEPEDYDDELHEFDFILLFKKIHSIILNSSKLTKHQMLVCSNIQRYVMWLYSEKLAHY